MARPIAPEAAVAPLLSRLGRRTASTRLQALRERPALAHGEVHTLPLVGSARAAAARPPRALVQGGVGLALAYALYTALNFSAAGAPAWAGQVMMALAGAWFAAVLVSDVRRWRHYDALQRAKAVLVWAAVLVFALAV